MMTGFERYSKKTKRALFLEEMEQVVPWAELCALIEPHYPKAGNGRPLPRPEPEKLLGALPQNQCLFRVSLAISSWLLVFLTNGHWLLAAGH